MGLSLGLGLDIGRRGGRTGGGWLPSSLTGYVGSPFSVVYFRALGALWQNTAKTIPAVADGDPVRVAVCDGVEWAAPSDAARPLLWDEGGGKWSLYFDGVDDCLVAGDLSALAPTAGTVGIRYLDDNANTATILVLGQVRNNNGYDRFPSLSYSPWLRFARIEGVAPPPPVGANTMLVRSSGSRWEQRINGTATITAAASYGEPNNVMLGCAISAGFDDSRIAGFALVGADIGDTDAAQLESYLAALTP